MTPGAGEACSRTSFAAEAVGVATAPVDPVVGIPTALVPAVGVVIAAVGVVLATPAVSIALVGPLASGGLAESPSPEHAVTKNTMIKKVEIRLTVVPPHKGAGTPALLWS
jgi:hypothetical protein